MSSILNSQRHIQTVPELKVFWQEFLPHLSDRCVLLLSGDVGAGKTTSVQAIAEVLGMKDVQSPSFAIHLRYENAQGKAMDHLDLYRLDDDDDLESSGFWDLFAPKQGLVVIEWAQRLDYDYLPLNWQRIEVSITKGPSETERIITSRVLG
ncbi:tRNA (adenosine(37)-N6)-threonylcarbamoyltransferase complex ATPase subunit type 1 TsaE [Bdellovibrio sp. ZAP7]|uniref:tRNA (adenosine(37)-N6)-threonylcarbamoyltransferase complex ATPase subunit type 1 TsaE n=1 Tax=Bdellovibrio sp. ZAP7 TaxID=2231053 RepID=UPI0011574F3D|nr:tRNA (adenosine(37)-N6)-threonylcarbamoyltransferase complex ATPase subunit type 1 TsaE [Bdellovibrio sp. ZAP7]QDK45579.1 tRNA (adenosine(37)-N6)-threonylcarbamoyltransferase complex ATPase subunit type 1 TsaE [Bdellovibrio sp. ZAP7]